MADVTPTGEMGKAMVNLKNLLAESGTFQTAIGATGSPAEKITAAKLRIHLTAYDRPTETDFTRPFALICKTGNDTNEKIATNASLVSGDMELRFDKNISEGYKDDPGNAELEFLNFIDAVIAEMETLSNQPGYLAITAINIIEGPTQIENEAGIYIQSIRLSVDWGLKG